MQFLPVLQGGKTLSNYINKTKNIQLFMYRRPILCTLYDAVDFLNVLKKYINWREVLGRNVYITCILSCGPMRASKHIRANVFPLAENKLEKLRRHNYAALT